MTVAMREDRFSHTVEDAAEFERDRADYAWYDDRRPSAGDLADDAVLDRQLARSARPPDPHVQHMLVASQLRLDVARATRKDGGAVPSSDVVYSVEGLVPNVVRLDGINPDHPAVAWLEGSPRWDVLIRDGAVFVRPSGAPESTDEPPF